MKTTLTMAEADFAKGVRIEETKPVRKDLNIRKTDNTVRGVCIKKETNSTCSSFNPKIYVAHPIYFGFRLLPIITEIILTCIISLR